jgi:uncharacterized membrane protein
MSEADPRARDQLPLGRLEAFSDGVFAIAITLLVLELAVAADAAADLLGAILDQWPAYLAYLTSFLTIGGVWLRHAALLSLLRAADGVLYRLNLLVLLLTSFLPFPTKLLAEFIYEREAERIAVVFYGLVLLTLALAMTALARYALGQPDLVRADIDEGRRDLLVNHAPRLVFHAVAIGVGYLLPRFGIGLYLAIALYVVGVSPRAVGQFLHRR